MNRKRLLSLTWLLILLIYFPVVAGDAVPSKDYQASDTSNFPEILNVGTVLECGDFKIQVMGQPVVTKSSNQIIADEDRKFLIIRLGITNSGEETAGWLVPDSFHVRETYMGHAYGTYYLDTIMSAKASVGYSQPIFYSAIEPGKMMQTTLVFEVFPEAQGWIFEFTPQTFADASKTNSVSFLLPKALIQ